MYGLRELQERFKQNLLDEGATGILNCVDSGSFEPSQRTQIYRNNVFTAFTDALRAVYPVVARLVGDGFFLYAAHQYIKQFPSTAGDLHDYGQHFTSFLKTFDAAQELKYLPDVALLEWYYHEVYHERDSTQLDLQALAKVDPSWYESLRFELNPGYRLMHSTYPIVDVWRVNQDNYVGDQVVDLESGSVCVLVLRNGKEEVEMHSIAQAEYEMLSQIDQRHQLHDCLSTARSIDSNFDFDKFLMTYVHNKTLINFDVA